MVYQGPGVDPLLPPAVAGPAFLRDGTEVWVRGAQPTDRDLVLDLLEREAVGAPEGTAPLRSPTLLGQKQILEPASPEDRLCLLVLGDVNGRVRALGVGEYARPRPASTVAEIAFLVAGPFRGQGIATLLLARLARAAQAFGIVRFEARIRAENPEMLEVFRGSGFPFTEEPSEGEVDVLIPLTPEESATRASYGPEARSRLRAGGTYARGRGFGPGPQSRRMQPPRSQL